jgi:hypothetical protein
MPVVIEGMEELDRAFARAAKEAVRELRANYRRIAEPVRRDAQARAQMEITRIGPKWYRMRTGVTRRSVYIAPREHGVHSPTDPKRRPKFADLMLEKAMLPAVESKADDVEREVEDLMNHLVDLFNG